MAEKRKGAIECPECRGHWVRIRSPKNNTYSCRSCGVRFEANQGQTIPRTSRPRHFAIAKPKARKKSTSGSGVIAPNPFYRQGFWPNTHRGAM